MNVTDCIHVTGTGTGTRIVSRTPFVPRKLHDFIESYEKFLDFGVTVKPIYRNVDN